MLLTAVCSFSPFVFVTQCSTARFEVFAYVGKYKKASVGGTHSALRRLVTPGEGVGGFRALSGGQQIFPLKGPESQYFKLQLLHSGDSQGEQPQTIQ